MQKLEHQQVMLEEDIRECEEYLQHLRKSKAKEFKFVSDVKVFPRAFFVDFSVCSSPLMFLFWGVSSGGSASALSAARELASLRTVRVTPQ